MKYLFSIIIVISLLSGTASVAFAQYGYTDQSGTGVAGNQSGVGATGDQSGVGTAHSVNIENPISADNITELFQTLLDVVMVFAIPIIVFFIILAGFKYVTARGNENSIKEAHMALLYALIGGLLILGARVLIDVVSGTVDSIIH